MKTTMPDTQMSMACGERGADCHEFVQIPEKGECTYKGMSWHSACMDTLLIARNIRYPGPTLREMSHGRPSGT